MKKIGFFVGHANYVPHAKVLAQSILSRTTLGETYEIEAILKKGANIVIDDKTISTRVMEVPSRYEKIPFVDKMLAASLLESQAPEGYIWLDVESYFVKTPIFDAEAEILINPADKKNVGDRFGAKRSLLWQKSKDYFGLTEDLAPVQTQFSKEKIYPYFNVGFVAVHQNKGLFGRVKEAMAQLLADKQIKAQLKESYLHAIFFHQVVFSCGVLQLYDVITPLPEGVNVPMHLYQGKEDDIDFNRLTTFRYDNYFDEGMVSENMNLLFGKKAQALKSHWYY